MVVCQAKLLVSIIDDGLVTCRRLSSLQTAFMCPNISFRARRALLEVKQVLVDMDVIQ